MSLKVYLIMKQDVDSILLANWYLIKCKMEKPSCPNTEVARKYLVAKINKALFERSKLSSSVKQSLI